MATPEISRLHAQRSDLKNAGRFTDAIPIQREILSHAQANGTIQEVSNAWNYLSMLLYRTGQYEDAEQASRESLTVYQRETNPSDETRATYEMLLATILAAQNKFADAVMFGTRALEHYSIFHNPPDEFLQRMQHDVELMVQHQMINSIRDTLAAYERINHGCNHGAEFQLHRLPESHDLLSSLESYFASQHTSISEAQPASEWHIQTYAIDHPRETLATSLRRWLLESRPEDNAESPHGLTDIEKFTADLVCVFDIDSIVTVKVRPPLWYGCEWEDFAFRRGNEYYLLHLGYSD